jgi:hypothetical protein
MPAHGRGQQGEQKERATMAFGPPPAKDANAGAPVTGLKLSKKQELGDYHLPGQTYHWRDVEIMGIHPGLLMAQLKTSALPLPGDVAPRGMAGVRTPKGAKKKATVDGETLADELPTDARERKVLAAGRENAYLSPDTKDVLVCPFENLRSMFIDAGKCFPGTGLSRACGAAVLVEPDFIPFLDPETDKPLKFNGQARVVEHPVSSRRPAGGDVLVLLYKAKSSTGKRIATARPYLPAWKLKFRIGFDGSVFQNDEAIEIFKDNVLAYAGGYIGLMAWRPGAPKTPGPFGRYQLVKFEATK